MKRMYRRCLPALALLCLLSGGAVRAQQFQRVPMAWTWLDGQEVAFTFDGSFTHPADFVLDAKTGLTRTGAVPQPGKRPRPLSFPPDWTNATLSPDSSRVAFTRGNDLWVCDRGTGEETRLTADGSDVILNGYASWVYYEEIFGRPSRYRAFWWSPDSRKIAFYRFDNTRVPLFPIYSPYAEDAAAASGWAYGREAGAAVPLEGMSSTGGSVRMTRYPKCGDPNPSVRIGIADLDRPGAVVWADFDAAADQYFGTPFWGADSEALYVQREPRQQNQLDLYAVSPADGSLRHIYHEAYPTWLDWIDGMLFGRAGLYMVRSFETGWQQVYYLSYDGKVLRRLTDGENWRVRLLDVKEGRPSARFDGTSSEVFFTAERDARTRTTLYAVSKGRVRALSDPAFSVGTVSLSPDLDHAVVTLGNVATPDRIFLLDFARPARNRLVADAAGPDFPAPDARFYQSVSLTTSDGLSLPGLILYPKDFDPSRKYPVHMDIYGGPDTPLVRDRWRNFADDLWFGEAGIIQVIADCRAAGHNGREGLDQIYRQLSEREVEDFVAWADYLKSLPYVDGEKIGVEGFSFGGTMTALLVMDHPDAFHYGIAGGGVYDWALYDTHYTERFMDTPQRNPEGYARTRAASHAARYPTKEDGSVTGTEPVMLRLTHGTGDDNVHFQNTLLLVDALLQEGKRFDLMVYPDGMHGYRGRQAAHFEASNRTFWLTYLKR